MLIGFGLYYLLPLARLALPLSFCLACGALIAPTDPIAVTSLLRKGRAPANLENVVPDESVFNDGVGIVVFLVMAAIAVEHPLPGGAETSPLLREAGGGIVHGAVLGSVAYLMLKSIDSYKEEVLLTVAAVIGGYSLAHVLAGPSMERLMRRAVPCVS